MMSPFPSNGGLLSEGLAALLGLSRYSQEEIVAMVNQQDVDTKVLRTRMEEDFGLYRLDTHVNLDPVTGEALKNYAVYTSNAPRVFADKVISWEILSELLLRVPHIEPGEHDEEADNLKERFAIGNLRAADERLKGMLYPSLRAQQAFYVTVRGGYIGGRCLLARNGLTGRVYADITAWDPMHIYWGVGADGLDWVCYKIKKTRAQIRSEYGIDVAGEGNERNGGSYSPGSSDAEREGIEVYDFYDSRINTIITARSILKEPTPHGSPRVPCYLVLVGAIPLLQSDAASDLVKDVGESIYAGLREVYDKNNDIMSIMLEIVERARRQTVVTESRAGNKTLPEDPFVQGTAISLATGEKVYTLDLQKMAQESGVYMTQVAGEIQRASLPYSSYGETPFQLSGFAITQLRQATETVLSSRVEALSGMYLQIANLLYDQFMTGMFDGMQLSGVDSHRARFNQRLTPEMLARSCDYEARMVSHLPQDDMSKWGMAEIAKRLRLQSDEDILDNIIGIQDSAQAIDKVKKEMAEQGLPEAVLYSMMMAAAERGEMELANLYLMEYQRLMAVKMGQMPPSPMDAGGGRRPSAPPNGGVGGQRPEVMPNAMTGAPPQPETSNNGPSFVAPNTPRPGAQREPA